MGTVLFPAAIDVFTWGHVAVGLTVARVQLIMTASVAGFRYSEADDNDWAIAP